MKTDAFKINISQFLAEADIAKQNLDISGMIPEFDDEIQVDAPIKADVTLRKIGGDILADIDLGVKIVSFCSRCGKEFTRNFKHHFENIFSKKPNEIVDEKPIKGNTIDLADVIIGEIIINMPIKNLCSNNCK